jgi:hypothetical protein
LTFSIWCLLYKHWWNASETVLLSKLQAAEYLTTERSLLLIQKGNKGYCSNTNAQEVGVSGKVSKYCHPRCWKILLSFTRSFCISLSFLFSLSEWAKQLACTPKLNYQKLLTNYIISNMKILLRRKSNLAVGIQKLVMSEFMLVELIRMSLRNWRLDYFQCICLLHFIEDNWPPKENSEATHSFDTTSNWNWNGRLFAWLSFTISLRVSWIDKVTTCFIKLRKNIKWAMSIKKAGKDEYYLQ